VVSVPQEVYGVKDTLTTLRELDKALYREAMKKIRTAAKPLEAEVRSRIPAQAPLSGWERSQGRFAWNKANTKVMTKVGGRRPRTAEHWPLCRIVLMGAAANIYDMAGKSSSSQFTRSLTAAAGSPSRAAWPAAEARMPAVEAAVKAAVNDAARAANRSLAWRGGR
jgi:hypothetical protein